MRPGAAGAAETPRGAGWLRRWATGKPGVVERLGVHCSSRSDRTVPKPCSANCELLAAGQTCVSSRPLTEDKTIGNRTCSPSNTPTPATAIREALCFGFVAPRWHNGRVSLPCGNSSAAKFSPRTNLAQAGSTTTRRHRHRRFFGRGRHFAQKLRKMEAIAPDALGRRGNSLPCVRSSSCSRPP